MNRGRTILALGCLFSATVIALAAPVPPQKASAVAEKPPRNLAILIFEHVQIIDYTGPYETFGHVYSYDQPRPFNIYTVAETTGPITTAMGMSVNPKYSIDNTPRPDILVVPGGGVNSALNSPKVMKWVKDTAKDSEIVMSVCNGAFILAKAGLLDGLEATTTASLIEEFKEAAPKTKVVSDKRFVDNGKIITTAGLSSGIDGSLHVVERLYGRGTAEMAALGMEYNWDPDSKYARAALADKYLPYRYDVESVVTSWIPAARRGDTERWENSWTAVSEASASEILARMETAFSDSRLFARAPHTRWVRQSGEKSGDSAWSLWKFTDELGNPWEGSARVESVAGRKNSYVVSVKVSKATLARSQ